MVRDHGERDHDFAHLGVAMIIDLVEGYAGLSPQGPVNPISMARAKLPHA
jgi:hypothetical protein